MRVEAVAVGLGEAVGGSQVVIVVGAARLAVRLAVRERDLALVRAALSAPVRRCRDVMVVAG